MKYIDIHNHCAWGIDDGVRNIDEAKQALKLASQHDSEAIIATPHLVPGQIDEQQFTFMNKRIAEFKQLASDYGIEVYAGNELFLNNNYLDAVDNHLVNSLANSNYILMELDVRKDIDNNDVEIEEAIYELTIRGYKPVIAHVERYFHHGIDLSRVKSWIKNGAYIQVNRTSINGDNGKTCQKNAEVLMAKSLVHIVASDAHSAKGKRIPILDDCYSDVSKRFGEEFADNVFYENQTRIINNEEVKLVQSKIKKENLWGKIWRNFR